MIRVEMSAETAETLSSFLITAAERFKEDARICREEKKRAASRPSAVALESIAMQFDKQEAEARAMSAQLSDAPDMFPLADARDDMVRIDPDRREV